MKYLRKFNEEYVPLEYLNTENKMRDIFLALKEENDVNVIKELIENSIKSYSEGEKAYYTKTYVNYALKISLQLKRHEITKYILVKYKNTYIKSDDITAALTWVRNTELSDTEKEEATYLLSKYVGYIYDKYNYKRK